MELNREFTIESFKQRKHEHRSDKGKHHNYPKNRGKWTPRICLRHPFNSLKSLLFLLLITRSILEIGIRKKKGKTAAI
jgi:hypothetical protein